MAAHAAGFADAAHLSRTSRSVFGFPPSAMHMAQLNDDGSDKDTR
jgi:transcriptional regulator GlxA family with amidase domain